MIYNGKIVNETENQSALHPKYRKYSDDHNPKSWLIMLKLKLSNF